MGGRLTSDPNRSSLGLLPSGPDPVGEWLVHRQPPGFISAGGAQKASRRRRGLLALRRERSTEMRDDFHSRPGIRHETLLGLHPPPATRARYAPRRRSAAVARAVDERRQLSLADHGAAPC